MKRLVVASRPSLLALFILAACQQPAAPPVDERSSEPSASAGASPSSPSPPAPAPATDTLTEAGFGTLRIGAAPAAGFRDDGSYDGACRIFTDPARPGIAALVIDGIVDRISLRRARGGTATATPVTAAGIGIGATEAAVRAAYRPLREEPHEHLHPEGKNLYTGEGRTASALRFEIGSDGRVRDIHAGRAPALAYSEGCS